MNISKFIKIKSSTFGPFSFIISQPLSSIINSQLNTFLITQFSKLNFVNGLRSSPRMVQIHFLMRFSDAAWNFSLKMVFLKNFLKIFHLPVMGPLRGTPLKYLVIFLAYIIKIFWKSKHSDRWPFLGYFCTLFRSYTSKNRFRPSPMSIRVDLWIPLFDLF